MHDGTHDDATAAAPAVSLIVPVHDVEEYLDECLASIAAQSIFERLEVVLLEDGSTDRSGEIAEAFAARHANVTVVRQDNVGLSRARNLGLSLTTGPFVAYLDSDDVLPPRSIEQRLDAMLKHNADLVIGGVEMFPTTHELEWARYAGPGQTVVVDDLTATPDLVTSGMVSNRLFRRADLERADVAFPEGRSFEDAWVSVPLLLRARRIVLVGDSVYGYRQRNGSIMSTALTTPANYLSCADLGDHLLAIARTLGPVRVRLVQRYLLHFVSAFVVSAPRVMDGPLLDEVQRRFAVLFADVPDDLLHESVPDDELRTAVLALRDLPPAPEPAPTTTATAPRVTRAVVTRTAIKDTASGEALVVHVTARVPAPRGLTAVPVLRLRHAPGRTVALVEQARPRGSGADPRTRDYRAVIPLRRLTAGRSRLQVVLVTADGRSAAALRPAPGFDTEVRVVHRSDIVRCLPEGRRVVVERRIRRGARIRGRLRSFGSRRALRTR
jgi:hypothetical protein